MKYDKVYLLLMYVFVHFFWIPSSHGQHWLVSNSDEDVYAQFNRKIRHDTNTVLKYISNRVMISRNEGHIFASLDDVNIFNDSLIVDWYIGPKFKIIVLSNDETTKTQLPYYKLSDFQVSELRKLASNGRAFSSSTFKHVMISNDTIYLKYEVIENEQIKWGKIEIPDTLNLSQSYLLQLLQIKSGANFEISKLDKFNSKFKNLPFLRLTDNPQLKFVGPLANIYLPLQSQKASKFDFLIGVLPSNDSGVRKWSINGELSGDFMNTFGQGERLNFLLRRLSLEDQQLRLGGNLPYLLGTAFGLEGDFEIRRNRNLTIDALSNFGFQYLLANNKMFKLIWTRQSSNLINIDNEVLLQRGELPQTLDYSLNGGGVEFVYNSLNYQFNPKSGIQFKGNLGLARRKVIINEKIITLKNDQFDFSSAYDSIKLQNSQVNLGVDVSYFYPVSNWATTKIALNAGVRYNNDRLAENELFRIGGNKLLRGFDELSILTSSYIVTSAEFRILLDANSFISLPFIDYAVVSPKSTQSLNDPLHLVGVGIGMSFSTRAGIFNISFASGNYNNQGFDFANTKLHFGYLSLF